MTERDLTLSGQAAKLTVSLIEPSSEAMLQVRDLGRDNRGRLGFLPDQAFTDRANAGTLLGCFQGEHLVGYALYDLPRQEVALRHLCVRLSHRGAGVARRLVAELASSHADRWGIGLLCRRDYGLDNFWESLGFIPTSEKPGRSSSGQPLTRWWMRLSQPSMFDWVPSPRAAIALDANIVADLHLERSPSAETRGHLPDWLLDEIELVVTSEVTAEANKHAEPAVRNQLRDAAGHYRRVTSNRDEVESVVRQLKAAVAPTGARCPEDPDLRQIAICKLAGVQALVTRDGPLLAALSRIAEKDFQVRLIRPVDVATFVDELASAAAYAPVALAATALTAHPARAGEIDGLERRFIDTSASERSADFRRLWQSVKGQGGEVFVIASAADEPLALFSEQSDGVALHVKMLRVAPGRDAGTLTRQIVWRLRQRAVEHDKSAVLVSDPTVGARISRSLIDEGYAHHESRWIALCPRLVNGDSTMAEGMLTSLLESIEGFRDRPVLGLKAGALDRHDAAEMEQRFWPAKFIGTDLSTLLVPIQARWAQELFDDELNRLMLWRRNPTLGLSRENVYYRTPTLSGVIRSPARILWYVSRDPQLPGSGAVRACSLLTEVTVGDPRVLSRRFGRFGVLDHHQVTSLSRHGTVMVMRFTGTERFTRPVSLANLTNIFDGHGKKPVIQSPSKVSAAIFHEVYNAGTV